MFNPKKIEEAIGVVFNDKNILKTAFTHRSHLNEKPEEKLSSNERLEFLGDAILEFWVSRVIFNQFPKLPEGLLTNFRSRVVYTPSLADIAQKLNLGQFLLLSVGEEKEGGRENQTLLANTFEALVGAIFQDQGLKTTEKFLEKNVLPRIETVAKKKTLKDYKSRLQELVQEKFRVTPEYRLLKFEGPDHERTFLVGIFIANKKITQGQGLSKQKAQQQAAQKALKKLAA
ncbi:MAG: ribonuclease III [Candidatus Shapirobacteria bacterium]|nr:ribonuclease III [Candidatus Shapirobacteria bacterium]MDD5481543.1 ribonuclease III [Candidatus Shapirobacteria bacterium]